MLNYFKREHDKMVKRRAEKPRYVAPSSVKHKKRQKAQHTQHITKQDISDVICRALGKPLDITNLALYEHALTHYSYYNMQQGDMQLDTVNDMYTYRKPSKSTLVDCTFERPEFLGDTVFDMMITEYIYHTFPSADEGFLTKLRSLLVQSDACIRYARFLGLDKLLRASPITLQKFQNQEYPKIYEDILEAFIAAMYLDFNTVHMGVGFIRVRQFVHGMLQKVYGGAAGFNDLMARRQNFKDLILQDFQNCGWPQPRYYDVPLPDIASGKFAQCVYIPRDPRNSTYVLPTHLDCTSETYAQEVLDYYDSCDIKACIGYGDTKKQAQQIASKHALDELQVLREKNNMRCQKILFRVVSTTSL